MPRLDCLNVEIKIEVMTTYDCQHVKSKHEL